MRYTDHVLEENQSDKEDAFMSGNSKAKKLPYPIAGTRAEEKQSAWVRRDDSGDVSCFVQRCTQGGKQAMKHYA